MNCVEVLGQVDVARTPETGKAVLWVLATIVVAVATAWGLAVGRYYMVIGLPMLAFTIGSARRASMSSEARTVGMSFCVADGVLRVEMQGARLFNGHYVNQRYLCALADIDHAGANPAGNFVVRARRLESFAVENGQTLDHRVHEFTEVVFKTDPDSRARLEAFMQACQGRA